MRRKVFSEQLHVMVTADIAEAIEKQARDQRTTASEVARRALAKGLGLDNEENDQ